MHETKRIPGSYSCICFERCEIDDTIDCSLDMQAHCYSRAEHEYAFYGMVSAGSEPFTPVKYATYPFN